MAVISDAEYVNTYVLQNTAIDTLYTYWRDKLNIHIQCPPCYDDRNTQHDNQWLK